MVHGPLVSEMFKLHLFLPSMINCWAFWFSDFDAYKTNIPQTFMLPEGRANSGRFVHPSVRLSHFCLDHIFKSIEGNLMKLDTLIEGHEGNCKMQKS